MLMRHRRIHSFTPLTFIHFCALQPWIVGGGTAQGIQGVDGGQAESTHAGPHKQVGERRF